jgi:hypothetical protein
MNLPSEADREQAADVHNRISADLFSPFLKPARMATAMMHGDDPDFLVLDHVVRP